MYHVYIYYVYIYKLLLINVYLVYIYIIIYISCPVYPHQKDKTDSLVLNQKNLRLPALSKYSENFSASKVASGPIRSHGPISGQMTTDGNWDKMMVNIWLIYG